MIFGNRLSKLVLSVVILWTLHETPSACAESYYGQVVDEETGEPLEGAGITVIWYRVPYVYKEYLIKQHRRFQSAQETLTDASGRFSLEASPGIDWHPLTHVLKEPYIVIFKPGYQSPLLGPFAITGSVIRLPRLETEEEHWESRYISGLAGIPRHRIPILTWLMNLQRESLGLRPIW
jgi:hypothetical protein